MTWAQKQKNKQSGTRRPDVSWQSGGSRKAAGWQTLEPPLPCTICLPHQGPRLHVRNDGGAPDPLLEDEHAVALTGLERETSIGRMIRSPRVGEKEMTGGRWEGAGRVEFQRKAVYKRGAGKPEALVAHLEKSRLH